MACGSPCTVLACGRCRLNSATNFGLPRSALLPVCPSRTVGRHGCRTSSLHGRTCSVSWTDIPGARRDLKRHTKIQSRQDASYDSCIIGYWQYEAQAYRCCSYRIDTTCNVVVLSPPTTTTSSSTRFASSALASGESMLIADVFALVSSGPTIR